MSAPAPDFSHLLSLTDARGTFEHARFDDARVEHGYCTDDMARVLVVATREPNPSPGVVGLAELSLRFLSDAQRVDGRVRNRLSASGEWSGPPTVDDCWGRSLWGLGTASARSVKDSIRQRAKATFERAAHQRSPSPRATAYAALGAAEVLATDPRHGIARRLISDAADTMHADVTDRDWPWPEPRLTYANAVLPEAMIAAGHALEHRDLVDRGLLLLSWLLDVQTVDGHLSVVPAGGAAAGDQRPAFDQQPIEVAAIADACARASAVDDDPRWPAGVSAAVDWFLGANDGHRVMWDPETGGGFDGLEANDVNRNEGAESTLALLSTLQHARCLVTA